MHATLYGSDGRSCAASDASSSAWHTSVMSTMPTRPESPAGLRLRDDEGGRIRALHQVGGRGHVVVLVNRRHRRMHDVRDRSRGRRRMLC